jgi:hypothetical protein
MHYQDRMAFIVMNVILTGIGAVAGGTILWLLWDGSLTAMFPSAVSSGILAEHLAWWPAVKIVWIFSLLFNTTRVRAPKPPAPPKEEKKVIL